MSLLAGPAATERDWRSASAGSLYDDALVASAGGSSGVVEVSYRGETWPLPLDRWCAPACAVDLHALGRLRAALPARARLRVLDLGCGPGRHAAALAATGLHVLGVDLSASAVGLARARGVPALRADALGPLPHGHHGWDGVLLLDGNIGIGGDPQLLLCRVRDLLPRGGQVLVELDPDDRTDAGPARLVADGRSSDPFSWARLGPAHLERDAAVAGLAVLDTWTRAGRRFAVLVAA